MHLLLQYPILNSNHSFHTTPWVVMCFPHPSNAPGRLKYNVSIAYYPVEQHPAATGKTHDTFHEIVSDRLDHSKNRVLVKYDTWVSSLLSFLFVMPSFYTNLQILKILFFASLLCKKCNHLTLHLLLHKLSKTLKLHFITNLLLLIEGITRMSQNYLNIDRFIYGGDYNPEQWLDRPDIFKQDLLLMKKSTHKYGNTWRFLLVYLRTNKGLL